MAVQNSLSQVYQKDPNIVFRRIADEFILVPIRQKVADLNCIYVLNEVGALIWELIDGKKSLAEILGRIIAAYDVDPKTAKDDFLLFISQLVKTESVGYINA